MNAFSDMTFLQILGLSRPRQGFGPWWLFWLLGVGSMIGLWLGWFSGARQDVSTFSSALFWFSVMLYYPMLEELLFRGALQGALLRWGCWSRRKLLGVTGANLVASLGFVAAHLLHQDPIWAMAVFVPALVFGFCRDYSGSVFYPVILHALWNGSFFLGRLFASGISPGEIAGVLS